MSAPIDVVVFGIGGHGRECASIVDAAVRAGAPFRLLGFVDDVPGALDLERVERLGSTYLGPLEAYLAEAENRPEVVLGIGSGAVRQRIATRLDALGLRSPVLAHPSSSIGLDVTLAPGAVLFAGARLTTNIALGRHAHVNQNATVGHDSVLGDFASVNPSAAISGNVTLGEAATVGAGAVVLQGLTVGPGAFVGGAACVVKDIGAGVIVKGVPAR